MKNPRETKTELHMKKEYVSPVLLEIVLLEMEYGIAASSVSVNVKVDGNGNALPVDTDWEGNDDQNIGSPF
ncbi:hypothetical protein [Elizabethkingia ursingii]